MGNQSGLWLDELEKIAQVKAEKDLKGDWFKGSETYLTSMLEEVQEVREELSSGRQCFLEDELGDLLWNFVCVLEHLSLSKEIDKQRVYERAVKKYKARVTERSSEESWEEVKNRQKMELVEEVNKFQLNK